MPGWGCRQQRPWCQCPGLVTCPQEQTGKQCGSPADLHSVLHRKVSFFMSSWWGTLVLCVTDGSEIQHDGANPHFSKPDFLVWVACIAR